MTLTKPEVAWVRKLAESYEWVMEEYPELFSSDDEHTYLIVKEILSENSNT